MNRIFLAIVTLLWAATATFAADTAAQNQPGFQILDRASDRSLTLDQAVALALASDDPYLLEPGEKAGAYDERGIADAQLPDPKLRFTFANWPTNSFSYTQEPMTQIQLGVSQAFPKGDTLKYRREQRQAQAKGARFNQDLRRREIILDTRMKWLDLYYWQNAAGKVKESRQAVAELIEVIEAIYATGRETSQDILRARLELSLLDDQLLEINRQASMVRANLSRRIGNAAEQALAASLPAMRHPSELSVLVDLIQYHPAAQMRSAAVEANDKLVSIAGEQHKPGWAVNVGYGARGSDRADFATVGVVMDVPLFTKNRQDKQLSAAKKTRQATRFSLDSVRLDLLQRLQASYANWQRLQERVALYQSVVLLRAKETTEASLTSYQSGVTDFPELVRARLAQLNTELKLQRLQADRLMAQAQLLFLEGEDDA